MADAEVVDEPASGASSGYPDAPAEAEAEREDRGSRLGAFLGSASSFRQKASPFLSKAKQAIVEEAKQVGDDMRDIAGGVREGMQLTKQDLEEQTRGWRSAFGAKLRGFRKEEDGKEASSEAPKEKGESKLQAVRQNLAMTAKDVQELRQEVMNEVRHSVNDIRQVLRKPEEEADEGSSFMKVKAAFRKAGDKAGDLQKGLRHRLQPEPFWQLPSSCANYVSLEVEEAKMKQLGGKLKGLAMKGARKGKQVTANLADLGEDLRQKTWRSKEPKASEDVGDSIFAIGSDEDDWSDWEGSGCETPSTRSASARADER